MTILYRSFTWEFCKGQASFRQPTYKSNWQANAMFDNLFYDILDGNCLYHTYLNCLAPAIHDGLRFLRLSLLPPSFVLHPNLSILGSA
jgi:hypothetical protein